jgi:hypothetical protein
MTTIPVGFIGKDVVLYTELESHLGVASLNSSGGVRLFARKTARDPHSPQQTSRTGHEGGFPVHRGCLPLSDNGVHRRGNECGPGDTIWAPPGERHWHGASADAFVTHTAISLGVTSWGEPVSNDQYNEIPTVGEP